ncbi:radical SAM protein [Acidobacteria bacterium AH-259-A15]|nr:radical SAM protein [Acidobacteria bacterium AH-259-A15]
MSAERQYVVQGNYDLEARRLDYAIHNMRHNKAYRYAAEREDGDPEERLLEEFRDRFLRYRTGWRDNPKHAINRRLHQDFFRKTGFPPLCVDIETAAVCDLACPFCFRQAIATPDKLMSADLYRKLIDQCAELGVPSIKLNWRGEPLLQPRLPDFVDYAKRAGVLETIINTDAVTLTTEKAQALIEAGLDLLIYSFDGGTKQTYEKMRPGRFKANHFDHVYGNIRRFAEVRRELRAVFPRTKIQMVLMADTYGEQESFFKLFSDVVDDVSVKPYTERGGYLRELDQETHSKVVTFLAKHHLPEKTPCWRNMQGDVFVSTGRLACEQIYQRMMVTYDGRVSMCCYDWGSEYPIGYVDERAHAEGDQPYADVMEKAQSGAKGFELLRQIKMPKRYVEPPKRVQTLREIWDGPIVNEVRKKHVSGRLEEVPICRNCPFKETYRWKKLDLEVEPIQG